MWGVYLLNEYLKSRRGAHRSSAFGRQAGGPFPLLRGTGPEDDTLIFVVHIILSICESKIMLHKTFVRRFVFVKDLIEQYAIVTFRCVNDERLLS